MVLEQIERLLSSITLFRQRTSGQSLQMNLEPQHPVAIPEKENAVPKGGFLNICYSGQLAVRRL